MPSGGENTPHLSVSENVRFTFRKHERLCSKTAITQLIKEGKAISHYPFRLLYLEIGNRKEIPSSPAQLAISVPKRNFKRAVKRNLIKRRIRESYRINKALLYKRLECKNIHVNLLLVYVSTEILTYNEIERKLKSLLERLTKRLEEGSCIPADTVG